MREAESSLPDLPHRGPARLVERLLAIDSTSGTAIACIPPGSPFRETGEADERLPAVIAVEMAAQTAAAIEHTAGSPSSSSPPASFGMLVGLRDVRIHANELPADGSFLVRVELSESAPPLRVWSFSVRMDDSLLAEGRILTHRAE